jgi:hypothetical protein
MALVSDLITESFLDLGAIAAGETITTAEQTDAFNRLNLIVDQWSREELVAYTAQHGYFSIVAGTANYSLGPAGTWVTGSAPNRITGGRVVYGSFSGGLKLLSFAEFDEISDDGMGETAAIPRLLAADQGWPTIAVRLHPVPGAAATAQIEYWTALSQFGSVGSDLSGLPPGFTAALQKNLALHLFPQYARPGNTVELIAALAQSTKASLVDLNSRVMHIQPPAAPAKKAA